MYIYHSLISFRNRLNFSSIILLANIALLTACGGGDGVGTPTPTNNDTTPDAFNFVDQSDVSLNTLTESTTITISGINSSANISVTGGEYSIDSATFTSAAGTISNGQTVSVRHTSSASNSTTVNTVLDIGGVSDTFTTTTLAFASDTTPDAFSFVDQAGIPLNTLTESANITVSGINTTASITISAGEYSIDNGAFTSAAGTVSNGQTVKVRHTSSASNSTTTNTVLDIGGINDTFSTTTLPLITDTTPDAFSFIDQTDIALNALTESAAITISGINTTTNITISGGEYSINNGTYTSATGSIINGQSVKVRHTSSGSNSTTTDTVLTIGSVSDTFTTTTLAFVADTTPDAFTFTDQSDTALSTLTESASITVSGINSSANISVSNGEYSIDGGTYTSTTGTISNAQTVTVRHTSSASNSTTVDTVLTIGGVTDTFTTTTLAAVVSRTYSIVDTNQSTCYNSANGSATTCIGSGYDADYAGNQPSYTLTDGGLTVTDNVTGLIWLQSTDTDGTPGLDVNDKLSQAAAVTYCSGLTTAGHTWRLPSIKEQYSLILFSGKDASNYMGTDTSTLTPFIDDTFFDVGFGDLNASERIIDGQYATSTLYVSTTMNGDETMFGVNFVDGRIKGYPVRFGPNDKTFYVRCVTGNTSYGTNVFVDNLDSTISDTATGLMWQQDDSASTDWDNAVASCEAATTATHTDWRLPNTKELQSILDYTRSPDTSNYAAIDNTFFNVTSFTNEEGITDWGYYWASTTHVDNNDDGTNATYLSFGRALGYFDAGGFSILDVHGAGSQRSNDKQDVATEAGAASANEGFGTFYYHGPQGDILRLDNKVRCVRDL